MTPSKMLGLGDGEWLEMDKILALAYHAYEQGLCSCCGIPKRFAHDPEMNGWYEVQEEVCEAGAALEAYRRDRKGKELEPGVLLGLKDTRSPEDILNGRVRR